MRKITLFLCFFIAATALFAQRVDQIPAFKADMKKTFPKKTEKLLLNTSNTKGPGDTIYFFDFSNSANWAMTQNGAGDDWILEDSEGANPTLLGSYLGNLETAPQAVYDSYQFFNTPQAHPVHDAYLTYVGTPLDFSSYSGVTISWRQWHQTFNDDIVNLDVSTNGGSNWTTIISDIYSYVLTNDHAPSFDEHLISSFVAGESNVTFRFHYYCDNTDANYGGGYGWILDNILFSEPLLNELELTEIYPGFNYTNTGTYQFVPHNVYCDWNSDGSYEVEAMPMRVFMGATAFNNGQNDQTNVKLHVTVQNEALTQSYYDQISDTTITSFTSNTKDSLGMHTTNQLFSFNGWAAGDSALDIGKYVMTFEIQSDSVDEIPANNIEEFTFNISDNYYATDDGDTSRFDAVSPGTWSNGGADGEMIGINYQVWMDNSEVKSARIFIDGENTTFDGTTGNSATIKAVLYMSDGASDYNILLESDPIDVTQEMADSWLEIPFLTDGFSEFLPAEDYICGIQIVDYNGQDFFIGEDGHTPQINYATRWYFLSGTFAGQWATITNYAGCPTIHMIFNNGCATTATGVVTDETSAGSNDGAIDITVSDGTAPYEYSWTGPNGFTAITEDLTNLEGGIYTVEITDDDGNGCTISEQFTVNTVGINNLTLTGVEFYPNPTNGIVKVKGINNGTAYIYDILGKVVSTQTVTNQINLSSLQSGNYYIKVVTEEGAASERISLIK